MKLVAHVGFAGITWVWVCYPFTGISGYH